LNFSRHLWRVSTPASDLLLSGGLLHRNGLSAGTQFTELGGLAAGIAAPLAAAPEAAIRGSEGNDVFTLTSPVGGPNTTDGNDTVRALGGDDLVDAAGGNDAIDGGEGADTLLGGAGNDRIRTGDGFNVANGGDGNDTLIGGAGDDAGYYYDNVTGDYFYGLNGGTGDDSIDAGAGGDWLTGGLGIDTLRGGDGNDTLFGTGDAINESGADLLDGGAGDDIISAGSYDRAYGRDGNDELDAYFATDVVLDGGDGNDVILAEEIGGNTRLLGGRGNDVITFYSAYGSAAGVTVAEVDGGSGNDSIYADGGTYRIALGSGDDFVRFTSAADGTLSTGSGRDLITFSSSRGSESNPVVVTDFQAGAAGDRLDLDPLLQNLFGYTGENPFTSGYMRLVQDGADTVLQTDLDGSGLNYGWQETVRLKGVSAVSLTPDNFAGIVSPIINLTPQNLRGTSADDSLVGADGDDTLKGLAGADRLDGGFSGQDQLFGGSGEDTLLGNADANLLGGDADGDFAFGGAGNDTILGGDGDDRANFYGVYRGSYFYGDGLLGGAGDDSIDGGLGDDLLAGDEGNDTLIGGDGNDGLNGYSGDYGAEADVLRGGRGNDTLTGDSLDSLYGGSGDDELNGTLATSLMDGGAGRDLFIVNYGSGSGLTLLAGDGDDTVSSVSAGDCRIEGGLGSDSIALRNYDSGARGLVDVNGGGGNDTIDAAGVRATIDTGDGSDLVIASGYAYYEDDTVLTVRTGNGSDTITPDLGDGGGLAFNQVTVLDFNLAASGDRIDLSGINETLGLPDDADPFAAGAVRLAADGNNTILEVQRVGVGDGSTFVGVLVLQNVAAGSLTAAHFVQHVTPTVSANTARPVPGADTTLAVAESDSGVALGLQAPIDPDGGAVTIRMERITLAGGLALADGSDAHPGDELTLEQFKGLAYVSYGNQGGDAGSFRYSVTDNEGSTVMREVRIDVTPVPDAPYLYDIYEDSYVANGGTVFSIDLDGYVNDPDSTAEDLSFVVTGAGGAALPAWLNYDAQSHVLSGVAPYGTQDVVAIDVTVTDETGLSDATSFTLQPRGAYIYGGEADEVMLGTVLADQLYGDAGNDRLDGRAGADGMDGGIGNDSFFVDSTGDRTVELAGQGSDEVRASVSWTLSANTERLVLTGHAALNGSGNAEANTIIGNDAANRLSGAEGADTLVGGAGDDTLTGGAQADWFRIDGTAGANGLDRIVDLESGFGRDVIDIAAFFGRSGGSVLDGDLTGGDAFDAFTAPAAIQGQHVIALEDALGGTPSTGDIEALLRGFTFDNGSKQAFVVHDTTTGDGYLFYAQDRAGDGNAGIQSNELTLVAELDFAKGRTFDGLDAANFRTSENAASESAPAFGPAPATPVADQLHAWFGARETSLMQPLSAAIGLDAAQRVHEMY
jgi:Ca2+-binding RTX toxin-like protein